MRDIRNIAVIGAGISGILSSWLLQHKYQITLYEKNSYLGGHTNTFIVPGGEDKGLAVDTGFIVLNDKTYPNLHKFFRQLGVQVRYSDMSFGFSCEVSGLQYSGRGLRGLFAQPLNILKPRYLKFLNEIKIFCRTATEDLLSGTLPAELSMGQYLSNYNFSKDLIFDYVVPMGAAIWSAPVNAMLDFPALTFLNFFRNHGLLSLKDRPRWQTVVGGSSSYVKAFEKDFKGQIKLNSGVIGISRGDSKVTVALEQGQSETYDAVIMATHADHACKLVRDKTDLETELLGVWRYQRNHTVLHTDRTFLKIVPAAEASWNYVREKSSGNEEPLSVTYDMNRLQGLKSKKRYFVTLNSKKIINKDDILLEIDYEHPVFNLNAIKSQGRLSELNGIKNTWYCGSYFAYGFHEDAAGSAVRTAVSLGADWQ